MRSVSWKRLWSTWAVIIASLWGVSCQQSGTSFTQTDCQRLLPLFEIAETECKANTKDEECERYTSYARLALVLGCGFAPPEEPAETPAAE